MSEQDPLAHWPDRTQLTDAGGRTLLVFSRVENTRSGRRWADGVWRPPDVTLDEAVAESLATLSGHAVSTSDGDLVEAWKKAGAEELRHAHVMTHDLRDLAAVRSAIAATAEGLTVEPVDADGIHRHAERLGAIAFAAYPPGHPDHEHDTVERAVAEMHAFARGEVLGPVLPVSQLARLDGEIIGVAIIVDREGQAPDGGPWVLDICRDPDAPARGIGRAMLGAVLLAATDAGLPSITLVVSHANTPARRLYVSLGFVEALESWTLALP